MVNDNITTRECQLNSGRVNRNARHLTLDQAGHDDDLWISSATIAQRVSRFFAGESVRGGTLRTKLLRIPTRPQGS
jgi:hypothetical protein